MADSSAHHPYIKITYYNNSLSPMPVQKQEKKQMTPTRTSRPSWPCRSCAQRRGEVTVGISICLKCAHIQDTSVLTLYVKMLKASRENAMNGKDNKEARMIRQDEKRGGRCMAHGEAETMFYECSPTSTEIQTTDINVRLYGLFYIGVWIAVTSVVNGACNQRTCPQQTQRRLRAIGQPVTHERQTHLRACSKAIPIE